MPLQFTQKEVEKELRDILKHGYERDVSVISGVSEGIISGMFNPDNERKSCAFVTLQILCALGDKDLEAATQFWAALKRFYELSLKRHAESLDCVGKETGSLNKEVADVVTAHLQGKSFYEQLKEIDEAEAQLERTRKAVMCAIDKERELLRREFNLETQQAFSSHPPCAANGGGSRK